MYTDFKEVPNVYYVDGNVTAIYDNISYLYYIYINFVCRIQLVFKNNYDLWLIDKYGLCNITAKYQYRIFPTVSSYINFTAIDPGPVYNTQSPRVIINWSTRPIGVRCVNRVINPYRGSGPSSYRLSAVTLRTSESRET